MVFVARCWDRVEVETSHLGLNICRDSVCLDLLLCAPLRSNLVHVTSSPVVVDLGRLFAVDLPLLRGVGCRSISVSE